MKKFILVTLCFLYAGLSMAQSSTVLGIKEVILDNGLTVWLNEDHSLPKVFGAVVVKAGSKDSPDTGIAHYFEHIMFKGTDQIGTVDYASEKVYLDSIAGKYDELSQTIAPGRRSDIQKEINQLSIQAARYAIPNEFSRLTSRYGGSDLNAFTSYDCTVYHNSFSPQYMRQWAELNSQRLIRPVFRLFQSELETVYEEKNMYSDAMMMDAMEKFTERFFAPHPYRYPIIGSTENLKNPRLSEMEKFFNTYYVANNMGLILCGDFKSEEVIPILQQTFGRIRRGEHPSREYPLPAPFNGKEKMEIKLPLPLVKIIALGFRGIPANHPDEAALNLVTRLLNNDNGTGYLDLLAVNHKLLQAEVFNESLNDAGTLGIIIIPKLMFQSKDKAEQLVWNEIERIKNGDFNEELFNSLKLEELVEFEKSLESMDSRTFVMVGLLSQKTGWNDFLDKRRRIESLTKEDIIKAARKYFGKDYLYASKKKGNYPKNKLKKPSFAPIIPGHTDEQSDFGKKLELIPTNSQPACFMDFSEGMKTLELSPKATLYVTSNPVNELFRLKINYHIGTLKHPAASMLSDYLMLLGTDSLTFEKFRSKLQALGSGLSFDSKPNSFDVEISGFDRYFNETLSLVGDFMSHVKVDEGKMKSIKDAEKMSDKSFFKSADQIAHAIVEKVMFGPESSYLTKLPYQEIKKMKGEQLINLFNQIRQTACSFHYSGNLPAEDVAGNIRQRLAVEEITQPSSMVMYRKKQLYDKPAVYFFDQPKTSQTIIYGYVPNDTSTDQYSKAASQLFGNYFGGDMSSLVFQELREFRSYAYRANGYYSLPSPSYGDRGGALITMLSTQCDKTTDAIGVLDSLIRFMPEKPQKAIEARQRLFNEINNSYPSFRDFSTQADAYKQDGYTDDPNRLKATYWEKMGMKEIKEFYNAHVKDRPVVYVVVGDAKKIDLDKLASFGEVIHMKKEEFYR